MAESLPQSSAREGSVDDPVLDDQVPGAPKWASRSTEWKDEVHVYLKYTLEGKNWVSNTMKDLETLENIGVDGVGKKVYTDEQIEQASKGKPPFHQNLWEHLADDSALYDLQSPSETGQVACPNCKGHHPGVKPRSARCLRINYEMTEVPRLREVTYDPRDHTFQYLPGHLDRCTWEELDPENDGPYAIHFADAKDETEEGALYPGERQPTLHNEKDNGQTMAGNDADLEGHLSEAEQTGFKSHDGKRKGRKHDSSKESEKSSVKPEDGPSMVKQHTGLALGHPFADTEEQTDDPSEHPKKRRGRPPGSGRRQKREAAKAARAAKKAAEEAAEEAAEGALLEQKAEGVLLQSAVEPDEESGGVE